MLRFIRHEGDSLILRTSEGVIEIKLADTGKDEVKMMIDAST